MTSSADLTTRLIDALLEEAASLMADGRTRSALSRCYRALLLRPADNRCLRLAGKVHAAAGDIRTHSAHDAECVSPSLPDRLVRSEKLPAAL